MTNIEIFLSIDEKQLPFLSIPRSDIQRLAISPFRWIRYVMFAICGTPGDLRTIPNGPAVDYENTEIANDQNTYYYQPSRGCVFVDHEGLNDNVTISTGTICRANFRQDIIQRDGACVITEKEASGCDAAHLIPRSKGDSYITKVIQLRSENVSADVSTQIDTTTNGILLCKNIHSDLGKGHVAFIKTPNYGLEPKHIKRFSSRGDEREHYITLQWIKKPEKNVDTNLQVFQLAQNSGIVPPPDVAYGAVQNVDALFGGTGVPLPSTVILNYLYGIAAYKAWCKQGDGFEQMKTYHDANYSKIAPFPSTSDDIDDPDVSSGSDDPNDNDYKPQGHKSRKHPSTRRSGLEETMDELNMYLMYIQGITPEMAAERHQKEIEQEEQAAQEAGRNKVMGWRNHLPDVYAAM